MRKPEAQPFRWKAFFKEEGLALLCLALSFLYCFKDWYQLNTKMFLSLDSTVLYEPLTLWVHQHLTHGILPLISDLLYNGAPIAATSMAGVLSPFHWLLQMFFDGVLLYNVLFLLPFALYLFGAYFFARELSLSRTASFFLALLWTYNGHQMAQLDHQNMAWAHAFFPWALLALTRFQAQNRPFWLLLAALFWGLCLFSGHPQVVFLEGLFLVFWTLLYPEGSLLRRALSFGTVTFSTLLFTAPLTLFTGSTLSGGHWSEVDRFFHSWTPLNFMTLLFPWFFGRDQFDRAGSDYWWQYQFVEMQVAFSIVGLFFILWFFGTKRKERLWLGVVTLFGLLMALGKFTPVYGFVQSLPLFNFFRDPARYWFLLTWALGLAAAYAWDDWFQKKSGEGQKLATGLFLFALVSTVGGWCLLHTWQGLIERMGSWYIQHSLIGDSVHTQTVSQYLARLPEKIAAISANLDLRAPRVWGPLLFLLLLNLVVWNKRHWPYNAQKILLLLLVFVDLMAFRMPLGNSIYSADFPNIAVPPCNRALPLISQTNSPLPAQYYQYAFPNMNLNFNRAVLPFDANPSLERYNEILARLGWFAWVYKDRDLMGFTQHLKLLSVLGVDQIVSDVPFDLRPPFTTMQNHAPYVYSFSGIQSPAWDVRNFESIPWPQSIDALEAKDFNPAQTALLDPDLVLSSNGSKAPLGALPNSETQMKFFLAPKEKSLLMVQKTYLPGWKAQVNGVPVNIYCADLVLMAVPLPAGADHVDLFFQPASLRLGFFLMLVFLALFALSTALTFRK